MGSHAELSYTPVKEISSVVEGLNLSYHKGTTQPVPWRKEQLKQVWRMLDVSFPYRTGRRKSGPVSRHVTDVNQQHEAAFQEALYQDMGRLKLEAQLFEMALVKNEVRSFCPWPAPLSATDYSATDSTFLERVGQLASARSHHCARAISILAADST